MNDDAPHPEAPAAPTAPKKTSRGVTRIVLMCLAVYFVPACGLTLLSGGTYGFLVGIPFRMAAGIVRTPLRVLPFVTFDAAAIATFAVACVLLAIVTHVSMRSAMRSFGRSAWSPRATGALLGLVLALFVAAMAIAGAGHQVGWLLTTRERRTDNPWQHTPCAPSRAEHPSVWLEHWRIVPLDGLPLVESQRWVALPRSPEEAEARGLRPRLCGTGTTGGMNGQELDDDALEKALAERTQRQDPR